MGSSPVRSTLPAEPALGGEGGLFISTYTSLDFKMGEKIFNV